MADSWLAALDAEDRAQFFLEMGAALGIAASAVSAEPLETCLREWRATGEALADPARRAVLTGTGDDDYTEAERP